MSFCSTNRPLIGKNLVTFLLLKSDFNIQQIHFNKSNSNNVAKFIGHRDRFVEQKSALGVKKMSRDVALVALCFFFFGLCGFWDLDSQYY